MASAESFFILATALIICFKVTVISARGIPTNVDTQEGRKAFLCSLGYASGYRCQEREPLTYEEERAAIESFQRFTGLPVTGEVDAATREKMLEPRCDRPDIPTQTARYATTSKWLSDITWKVDVTHPAIPESEAIRVMQEAVQEWQAWMSTITVTQTSGSDAVIIIQYLKPDATGEHGDGYPFKDTTLAHAFSPTTRPLGGDIHYNMDFTFAAEPPGATEFSHKSVAVHELGHSLGLLHSDAAQTIMNPYSTRGKPYSGIFEDDKLGIMSLYGECFKSPCQNGGTCSHQVAEPKYRCACPADYTGTNCEIGGGGGYCNPSPCQNGGTCVNEANGYTCNCPDTHMGTNCETPNPCYGTPCQNGGTCTIAGVGYTCQCPPTHTGTNCETATPCSNNPCQNGGTCHPASNAAGYSCTCTVSYTGDNCATSKCATNPCQNGGTCTLDPSIAAGFRCGCPVTHIGDLCQGTVCDSSPCQNGGTCNLDATQSSGYSCTCTAGYTGTTCPDRFISSGIRPLPSVPWWTCGITVALWWFFRK